MWLPPFPSKGNEWFHITIALLGVTRHRKRREQSLFLGLSLMGSCRAWPSRRSKKGFPLARRIWGVWKLHSPLHQPSSLALKWPREGFLCAPVTTGSFATLWWVRGNYKDLNLLGLQQLWRNRVHHRLRKATTHSGLQGGLGKMQRWHRSRGRDSICKIVSSSHINTIPR